MAHRTGGFTLVELLVVVLILGIVATIAVTSLANALDKARQRATMADMRSVSKAIETYVVDHGFLPDGSGGLASLRTVLTPYQSSVLPLQDHWRHDLAYARDADGNYTLESFGKDGVAGADISVATRHDFNQDIVLSNGLFVAAPE